MCYNTEYSYLKVCPFIKKGKIGGCSMSIKGVIEKIFGTYSDRELKRIKPIAIITSHVMLCLNRSFAFVLLSYMNHFSGVAVLSFIFNITH